MPSELHLLWVLLPALTLGSWWVGQYIYRSKYGHVRQVIHPDYFKGLNFVLNEQQDRAIEVFTRMLEADIGTIDTYLTLGSLFRRRGEIDRAIQIHQNLIAKPTLNKEQRAQAILELGVDYMRSGLLDRAEGLFLEMVESGVCLVQAYTELLDIYQQEKDWKKAIYVAQKLEAISGSRNLNPMIAQFYCEQAQAALNEGNMGVAKNNIQRAMTFFPDCVRASLMEAKIYQQASDYKMAIQSYKRVESQNSDYIAEMISPIYACYCKLDKVDEFIDYLNMLVHTYGGISSLLMLTELIAVRDGENAAIRFITKKLKDRPNIKGIDRLIEYTLMKTEGKAQEHLEMIKKLIEQLIETRPTYKCKHCGFNAKLIHWQCPGCKRWETISPIFGIVGE